ncbi:MAG: hypothetical protein K6W08_15080, partial [Firmicutes bacterium]|nr:hypothetical protein [Bacillota bacterium]
VPFVTYDVGNARELSGGVVTADLPELIEVTGALLDDDRRRLALGEQGREAQRRHLEWDRLADRYEALYATLTTPQATGRG